MRHAIVDAANYSDPEPLDSPIVGRLDPAAPPPWVRRAVAACPDRFTLFTARVDHATDLTARELATAVATEYRSLARQVQAQARFPLRIWNFVPGIQAPMGAGDRYMAFNMGRFEAYTDWFGPAGSFGRTLPTASGVGVSGDTLWIHILGSDAPGISIENPRQTPAYRYSRRYGMRPPCFARATRFESTLLIGGTASILGEDSCHPGNVETQTHETLANLAALIVTAYGRPPSRALDALIDLRVHLFVPADVDTVGAILRERAPQVTSVEFVDAPLCRRELLVEIEGRAQVEQPVR